MAQDGDRSRIAQTVTGGRRGLWIFDEQMTTALDKNSVADEATRMR